MKLSTGQPRDFRYRRLTGSNRDIQVGRFKITLEWAGLGQALRAAWGVEIVRETMAQRANLLKWSGREDLNLD